MNEAAEEKADAVKTPEQVLEEAGKEFNEPKEVAVRADNYIELAKSRATKVMDPVEWSQMRVMAMAAIKARAIPAGIANAEQLMMIYQTGFEMGMGPAESVKSLYIVNGAINLYGAAVGKQLRKHGYRIVKYTENAAQCTVEVVSVKDPNETYTDTYSIKDAQDSGYFKPNSPAWKAGAARVRKLRYGALSLLIHTYLPEVLGAAIGVGEYSEDVVIFTGKRIAPVTDEAKSVADEAIGGRDAD